MDSTNAGTGSDGTNVECSSCSALQLHASGGLADSATAAAQQCAATCGASDYYVPVLGTECIEWLARDEGVFVDCTLGGGGHSSLLLERVGANAKDRRRV